MSGTKDLDMATEFGSKGAFPNSVMVTAGSFGVGGNIQSAAAGRRLGRLGGEMARRLSGGLSGGGGLNVSAGAIDPSRSVSRCAATGTAGAAFICEINTFNTYGDQAGEADDAQYIIASVAVSRPDPRRMGRTLAPLTVLSAAG